MGDKEQTEIWKVRETNEEVVVIRSKGNMEGEGELTERCRVRVKKGEVKGKREQGQRWW